jgi:aspartyl-tRNA(Asn)/glutamyl-tRNA(Gln) amidotransferase subunit A
MYANISAAELSCMIHKKEIKPSEICAYFLNQTDKNNPKLNIFNALNKDAITKQAEEMDKMQITPETPAIFGLPIALKDNICTMDLPTTCSSKMLQNYRSMFDSTVSARLKTQGALILGKTNMDEFGVSSEGGNFAADSAAAAVAADCVPFSLSSDTGGSISKSASVHSLVGYRPSYGAVSRYGLIPLAGSFDQIGTLCRTVSDTAILAAVICGHDENDSKSNPRFSPDFSQINQFNLKGKKIGVLEERLNDETDYSVKLYESLGAESVNISIPSMDYVLPSYYAILYAEASSNLSRFDGIRFGHRSEKCEDIDSLYINSRTEGFGLGVKKAIILGTYILSAGNIDVYYKKACMLRKQIIDEIKEAFKLCDVIITPVKAESDTVPAALAGLPSVSMPCMQNSKGTPANIQLMGNPFDDENLLRFAYILESELKKGVI